MEHIRHDAQPFVVLARDAGGTIVGLAPLCRQQFRDRGFRIDTIGWGGRDVVSADFLDISTEPGFGPAATKAILGYLWQHRSDWGLLQLGELMEGGPLEAAVEAMREEHGILFRRQEARICPYIPLPRAFDEYLATLSSSTRYHIRRRMRDVLEKQGARVEICSQRDDIVSGLEALVELHLKRWRREGLPGTLGRPGFAAFLRDICLTPPAGASTRLYTLRHQGNAAAALLAFHFRDSALYYQAGWDPDSVLAAHSPAVVLMAHSVRDSIEQGLRYYEFLRGDEAYKSRWTTTYRKTHTVLLARSFLARQYLHAGAVYDRVKRLFGPSPLSAASAAGVEAVGAGE